MAQGLKKYVATHGVEYCSRARDGYSSDRRRRPRRIHDDNVLQIVKGTCRAVGMRTQILTSEDIPANEAGTLGDRLGELVEGCDGFVENFSEYKFQMMSRHFECVVFADWKQGLDSSWKKLRRVPVETATDAAASKLATAGDRAQIYRWTLVMHDGVTKSIFAHLIPAKGFDFPSCEKVVKMIIKDLDNFGIPQSRVSVRQ